MKSSDQPKSQHYNLYKKLKKKLDNRYRLRDRYRMRNRACESIMEIEGWEWKQNTWVSLGLGLVSVKVELETERWRDWDWESLGSEAKENSDFWLSGAMG